MLAIHLNNLLFKSHHGIYDEEKLLGNQFEINCTIKINSEEKILHLHQSVDYVKAYSIIKSRMNKPTPLLETVADEIVEELHQFDAKIKYIQLSITKLHPPIVAFEGSVGVSIEKTF